MKKITLFALAALSLTLASCNKEQILPASENGNTITMTLNASVEQTKATISDEWKFAFTDGDKISLINNHVTDYSTVTRGSDGKFTGTVTAPQSEATWYAYYPYNNVSFANQTGTQAGAAAYYAYSGKQENVAAGSKNLDITLYPQTAILVITSKRASLDINVKTSDGKWVSGLTAKSGDATFDVTTSDDKVSLLKATKTGTYYVVVPAGVKIAIFDGDLKVKETKDTGLTAGKYYEITIELPTIADVLATVDGGFPQGTGSTKPSGDAWVSGSNRYAFVYMSHLFFYYSIKDLATKGVPLDTPVTPGENCYTVTSVSNDLTLTFNITNGKLTSINYSSTDTDTQENFGGTYTAPGVFSVSASKKVHFSQGNLIATIDASGTPTAWRFAANQYDYLGEGGANKTIGTAAGDVDLFGWSTSNNGGTSTTDNYGIKTSTSGDDYLGEFYDWGKAIGDGNTWRTLTIAEWQYLINVNGNENIRKGKYKYGVTVCGKANCLVLAPDDFAGTIESSYDTAAWASAEAAGLVCLPAAGHRYGSSTIYTADHGRYWSSSVYNGLFPCYVEFNNSNVDLKSHSRGYYGCSVRLVTDIK